MTIQERNEFSVIGIAARTTNAREMTGGGVIAGQWARFTGEGLAGRIPNRVDDEIVALYTDYARDEGDEYTFVLGVRVSSAEDVPKGMVAQHVPAQRYWVVTSKRGPAWVVVVEAWRGIWNAPETVQRAFRADFEVYDARSANPGDAVVDIWLGLV